MGNDANLLHRLRQAYTVLRTEPTASVNFYEI